MPGDDNPAAVAPYAEAALDYLRHGWQGVLPVRGKWPPPKGYTGAEGAWPSTADVLAWCEGPEGHLNIGLRLPLHVVGIDVDHYGGKTGGATLAEAEARWGALPATWITSSRGDGVSGIRLFTVPPGLKWPGVLGDAVEIIQYRHRYAVAWPSVHPDGPTYRWTRPDGSPATSGGLPHADELPALPEAWIDGLTGGQAQGDIAKLDLAGAEMAWLTAAGGGAPCPTMQRALLRAQAELHHGASRHDAAMRASSRIALLAAEGHTGALRAMAEVAVRFRELVADGKRDVEGEWGRMLSGAVGIAAARGVAKLDPCTLLGGASYHAPPEPGRVGPDPATSINLPTGDVAKPGLTTVAPEGPPAGPNGSLTGGGVDPVALALEVAQQRARRQARLLLDVETWAASFRTPPSTRTVADELALPDDEVTFRLAKILPSGGNALLTAQYKTGKTTFLINLLRALADERDFLGELAVTPLRAGETAATFNYEVGGGQFRRWLREATIEHPERLAVLNLRGYALPLLVPQVQDYVVDWLGERNVKVWAPDPWARMFTGANENDNTEVARHLDALDEIKERAGVREMVLATHTGRAVAEVGQERARGATRLDDWADVRWLLTRGDDNDVRYFRATGRDVEFEERSLQFNPLSRTLELGDGNRTQAKAKDDTQAVFAVLSVNPRGISKNQLEPKVGISNNRVRPAIDALVAAGRARVEVHGTSHLVFPIFPKAGE